VARLPEGNRNDGPFWAANRALDAGLTDLGDLAEAARHTGLDEQEIARTLASAQRRTDRPPRLEPADRRMPEPGDQIPEAVAAGHDTADRATRSQPARQREAEAS